MEIYNPFELKGHWFKKLKVGSIKVLLSIK